MNPNDFSIFNWSSPSGWGRGGEEGGWEGWNLPRAKKLRSVETDLERIPEHNTYKQIFSMVEMT